jgi:hypothetical protein
MFAQLPLAPCPPPPPQLTAGFQPCCHTLPPTTIVLPICPCRDTTTAGMVNAAAQWELRPACCGSNATHGIALVAAVHISPIVHCVRHQQTGHRLSHLLRGTALPCRSCCSCCGGV